jgi:hypothetical protein
MFGLAEPAPASADRVTSENVRLVSEKLSDRSPSQLMAGAKNGRHGGYRVARGAGPGRLAPLEANNP